MYIVLTVVAIVATILSQGLAGPAINCPKHYQTSFNGSCYFFSHDHETWTGSLISCHVIGGHLVEIESEQEYQFLQQQDRQYGDTRWIGLSNKYNFGEWQWATSGNLYDKNTFNMWAPGEPDNKKGYGDESCVVMDYFPDLGHDYTLADVNCVSTTHLYICEFESTSFPNIFGR